MGPFSHKRSVLLAVLFYAACMLAASLYAFAQSDQWRQSSYWHECGVDNYWYHCPKCTYRWYKTYDSCYRDYDYFKDECEKYHDYTKRCFDCLISCPSGGGHYGGDYSGGYSGGYSDDYNDGCKGICKDACDAESKCRYAVREYYDKCVNRAQCDCRCHGYGDSD